MRGRVVTVGLGLVLVGAGTGVVAAQTAAGGGAPERRITLTLEDSLRQALVRAPEVRQAESNCSFSVSAARPVSEIAGVCRIVGPPKPAPSSPVVYASESAMAKFPVDLVKSASCGLPEAMALTSA